MNKNTMILVGSLLLLVGAGYVIQRSRSAQSNITKPNLRVPQNPIVVSGPIPETYNV